MFNKQAAVFLQSRAAKASDFRSDKTRAACLLKDFKDISGKVYLNGFDNHDALVNFGNQHTKKTLSMKLLCKKIKSHTCLEILQSTNDTNHF